MVRGVLPPVPPTLPCITALHRATCCGVGLTPEAVLCYAGVCLSSGWSGAAGSVITLMWGIGGQLILVTYPNRNTAMTYKIFTDNEYSQTIELDELPSVGDTVHRSYRVLAVTLVEAARPYYRLDCEVQ
jgi:hypothetical protein